MDEVEIVEIILDSETREIWGYVIMLLENGEKKIMSYISLFEAIEYGMYNPINAYLSADDKFVLDKGYIKTTIRDNSKVIIPFRLPKSRSTEK